MNIYLKFNTGIFQKIINFFIPLHLQCLILVTCLIIITIFP